MNKIEFPLEVFPKRLQEAIVDVSYCTGFPYDFTAVSVLSACATAIGNSYRINVKSTWNESSSLFIVINASKGVNKSSPPVWALSPINKKEKEIYKQYKEYVKEWELDPNEKKKMPVLTKTIISDATPESVVMQLSNNPRGILIYYDELAGFVKKFNRYSNGDEEQFYLSAWSNKTIIVDRKTQISLRVDDPVLNIIGTIQPGIFDKYFKDKEESGFTDRWLICCPEIVEREGWVDDDPKPENNQYYHQLINNLFRLNMKMDDYDNITFNTIKYSKEAYEIIKAWQHANARKINSTNSEVVRGVLSKMETYINRFSLILHLIDHCDRNEAIPPYEVDINSAKKAMKLATFFTENALRSRESDPSSRSKGVWKEIYDILPGMDQTFTTLNFIQFCSLKNIPERTAKRYLTENIGKIFSKVRHGVYSKI